MIISDHFIKYLFSSYHILILTYSKCQFNYNKKSFQIFLSSQNTILILNLTILMSVSKHSFSFQHIQNGKLILLIPFRMIKIATITVNKQTLYICCYY